ncbi:MAG: CaiB/BaiF CoA transferase family protein [Dehalococcoidia bacterium]
MASGVDRRKVDGALSDIKVVDFGTVAVAPHHARYLADMGAIVVRVESHTRLETQRTAQPYKDGVPGISRSGLFPTSNSSKYGVTLDLAKPRGKEVALRLIKWADVVVEGFRPGVMERLGLDYESARRVKPDIIYLSSSQLGRGGPISSFGGFGFHSLALAGVYHLDGYPDREPAGLYGAYSDYVNPRISVAHIMAALDYRRRTGKGQYIEQAQLEGMLSFLAPVIMDYFVNNRIQGRQGNRVPQAAPHGSYPCRGDDGWVAIAVSSDEEWQALCRIVAEPWAKEARFATLLGRKQNEDALDALLSEWTARFPAEEVMNRLQAAGVPAGVVQRISQLFDDPQLKHRNHFRWLEDTGLGVHAYEALGFRLSHTPDSQFGAPAIGEHNEYVCKELLGMSGEEISQLLAEGVITTDADMP